MQKINRTILAILLASSSAVFFASAHDVAPARPELRADMREEIKADILDFKKERQYGLEQMKAEVKSIREAAHDAIASGTAILGSTTRKETINQIKGARKEFAEDRREDAKEFKKEIRDDVKEMRDKIREIAPSSTLKARLVSTSTIGMLALKLGVSTSSIMDRVASGTKLKEIVGDKISKEDLALILPPVVYERVASSSDKFVPRLLQRMFGEKRETVTESINEDGEVVQEVKSNVSFLRRLFGF